LLAALGVAGTLPVVVALVVTELALELLVVEQARNPR
jgi:hypothetical protein